MYEIIIKPYLLFYYILSTIKPLLQQAIMAVVRCIIIKRKDCLIGSSIFYLLLYVMDWQPKPIRFARKRINRYTL